MTHHRIMACKASEQHGEALRGLSYPRQGFGILAALGPSQTQEKAIRVTNMLSPWLGLAAEPVALGCLLLAAFVTIARTEVDHE